MKWILILLLPLGAGAETPIQEAETSTQLITHAHQTGLANRLQTIVWDAAHIEITIQKMKDLGEITSFESEQNIRAQLTLGQMFAKQGLLHEAVYLVFSERYPSDREIYNALMTFKNISAAREKGILLSEVVERALQFIPDVGVDNLHRIRDLAAYINTSEDQLVQFRDKWLVYDQNDRFVEIMEGGVLALLLSANETFIADVLSRGKLKYKLRRYLRDVELPPKPLVQSGRTIRDVEVLDLEYFESASLETYLQASSAAARRFFITDQIPFFTLGQLRRILAQQQNLWLKQAVAERLTREIGWRETLIRQQARIQELEQDTHELVTTLKRLQQVEAYDRCQLQKRINALRSLTETGSVQEEAIQILKEYALICDSAQFVNVTSSVITGAASRLRENPAAAVAVLEIAVLAANSMGLQDDHARKIKQILTDLAVRLTKSGAVKANQTIARLEVRENKFAKMTIPELEECLRQTEQRLTGARDALERVFAAGPENNVSNLLQAE